jgi:hypothetical protein
VLGRKNWLFAGSDSGAERRGAERSATILTVLETAARRGLDLYQYLYDVLVKLSSGWPNRRLDELLPHRWRELHAPQRGRRRRHRFRQKPSKPHLRALSWCSGQRDGGAAPAAALPTGS